MRDIVCVLFQCQSDFEYGVVIGIFSFFLLGLFIFIIVQLFIFFDDLNDLRNIDITKLPKSYLKDKKDD